LCPKCKNRTVTKNGKQDNRQQYRCKICHYQFFNRKRPTRWVNHAFELYCKGKQTLAELSQYNNKSISTLQRYFDQLNVNVPSECLVNHPINLIVDGTFFSRHDGVFVFRAEQKNLHWRFISTETLTELALGLNVIDALGYKLSSITLDGRRGMIQLFSARYPQLPIQMCQFHQTQIIRRYTTNNPKTECGKELKELMRCLTTDNEINFKTKLTTLYEKHHLFLRERNEQNQFKHRQLRSAFRSLKTNLPYLFTYRNFPNLNIPNTTNSCDGSFAHWKQKVKIHRGLRQHRRNKLINYLLNLDNLP